MITMPCVAVLIREQVSKIPMYAVMRSSYTFPGPTPEASATIRTGVIVRVAAPNNDLQILVHPRCPHAHHTHILALVLARMAGMRVVHVG